MAVISPSSARDMRVIAAALVCNPRRKSQGAPRSIRQPPLAHLRPHPPSDIGLPAFVLPPKCGRLICASCSSGRHFAYSFLQTSPRDDALAVRLTVPITRACKGLSPPSHRPDTIPAKRCSHTTRHAWRTKKPLDAYAEGLLSKYPEWENLQVCLVAGAGFEPAAFRL
jgi:hypothetical protein